MIIAVSMICVDYAARMKIPLSLQRRLSRKFATPAGAEAISGDNLPA